MIFLIIILIASCIFLTVLAIINTTHYIKMKNKVRKKNYYTPKLSSLHGKKFKDYIDNLTKDFK